MQRLKKQQQSNFLEQFPTSYYRHVMPALALALLHHVDTHTHRWPSIEDVEKALVGLLWMMDGTYAWNQSGRAKKCISSSAALL